MDDPNRELDEPDDQVESEKETFPIKDKPDAMDQLAESMKLLAVPFHNVHPVHQSHTRHVSDEESAEGSQDSITENEPSKTSSPDPSKDRSSQNKTNEYGYYEPEDDMVANLILNPTAGESDNEFPEISTSERSSPTGKSPARVVILSPTETGPIEVIPRSKKRAILKKAKPSKEFVRKMYSHAWKNVISESAKRSKVVVSKRSARAKYVDFSTGKRRKRKQKELEPKEPSTTAVSISKLSFSRYYENVISGAMKESQLAQSSSQVRPRILSNASLQKMKLGKASKEKLNKDRDKSKLRERQSVGLESANRLDEIFKQNSSRSYLNLSHRERKNNLEKQASRLIGDNTKERNKEQLHEQLLNIKLFFKGRTTEDGLVTGEFNNETEKKLLTARSSKSTVAEQLTESAAMLQTDSRRKFSRGLREASQIFHLEIKPSKHDRKLSRRYSTVTDQASYQLDCQCVDDPTEWVLMWGAGLAIGTQKAEVYETFDPEPDEVRFYADKAYCTLHFANTDDAENAKETQNGKQPINNQMVFLSYLDREPPAESPELLLPFQNTMPNGLTIMPEFISDEDENVIVEQVVHMRALDKGKDLKRRWVRHFGYEFRYDSNDVDPASPLKEGIPDYLSPLVDRLIEAGIFPRKPEQLTINVYKPGQGIPPHVDTHSAFEAPIVSLSLWADSVMDFRNNEEHSAVIVPRRSLLVMKKQARFLWKHGIASRTIDIVPDARYKGVTTQLRKERISLTFRLLRESRQCFCLFPEMCDSQQGKITKEIAEKLEKELVHEVYEEIATHFSSTRRTPWPKVKEFVQSISLGSTFLDVGCGNGKYFNLGEYIYEVGTDMSRSLLNIVGDKTSAEGVQSHCMRLPFKEDSFNAVICIAVLHHLCTVERRLEAVQELLRVLRPSGKGLIYVWAKDQRVKEVQSVYARQRELKSERLSNQKKCSVVMKNYSFLPIHEYEPDFAQKDMLVPWIKVNNSGSGTTSSDDTEVCHRFYHVFENGELEELLKMANPRPNILESYYDQGNWCVVFEKPEYYIDDVLTVRSADEGDQYYHYRKDS